MLLRVIMLSFVLLFVSSVYAEEQKDSNFLTVELQEGEKIRVVGDYHFIFKVSKDWKTLYVDVLDREGKPTRLDLSEFEVFIRPSNRRSPFKLTVRNVPKDQEGGSVTSHYAGSLDFIDHFKSFKVNTFLTINNSRCVSEFQFLRES